MRVKIQQFLCGKCHSWAVVGQSIGRELLKMGHKVDFISTDGVETKYVKDYIRPNLKNKPTGVYDIQISYTAMKNFPFYLAHGKKNRFGIYNYDGSVLPEHWIKYCQVIDKLLPSSEYSKKVFLDAQIPENKLKVVPHGIDIGDFNVEPYKFKTNKRIKILNVCGQVHRRKNLIGILDSYGSAFSKDDDVCLILKVVDKRPTAKFELSFRDLYKDWKSKNKDGPEVEIICNYIDNIESLFLGCDIHYSLSNIECFHIPSLQSMAAKKLTIQSNYGGNIDFMNKDNSLLVDGKIERCPPSYQYWTPSRYAEMFVPNKDDAVDKLRYAVNNYDKLILKFAPVMEKTVEQYSWENVTKKIISLAR